MTKYHSEITPFTIRKQIAHLRRVRVDVSARMYLAMLSDDTGGYGVLADEYRNVSRLICRLERDYAALVSLQSEQAEVVALVCELLDCEVRE